MQLASSITDKSYLANGLSAGTTYVFKVTARNSVGSSSDSANLSVLAADEPDAPTLLANDAAVTSYTQVGLTWQAPANARGSAVIDYRVWGDNASSGSTFTELASGLTSASYTATSLTQGTTY